MSVNSTVIRISRKLDEKLDKLAAATGRSKSYYATKAIERYLEDIADYFSARDALKKSKKRYSLAEAAEELGLDG